jgi:hypothetical protein
VVDLFLGCLSYFRISIILKRERGTGTGKGGYTYFTKLQLLKVPAGLDAKDDRGVCGRAQKQYGDRWMRVRVRKGERRKL